MIDAPADRKRQPAWREWHVTPVIESGVLALAISVAIATYFIVRGGGGRQQLLTPPLVALLLIANLAPSVVLIILLGRRIAKARAARSDARGEGRLHVRLVALFSMIATVPTVLAVLFASVMFQYGVEFWLSDRVSGVLKNATSLASDSYSQSLNELNANTVQAAVDISQHWGPDWLKNATSAQITTKKDVYGYTLTSYLEYQLFHRLLSEGAIFRVRPDNQIEFLTRVDEYGDLARQIDPVAVASVLRDNKSVVTILGNRIRIVAPIPGAPQMLLYAGQVSQQNVADDPRLQRVNAVVTDFKALQSRARALQLQFNAALFVVALLIIGLATWIALVVADRLVRPVGEMVDAARRVAAGDLGARVPDPRTNDEIGVLADAFNTMTGRLEQQTRALESRRALIEAVMSGVSAGVVSVDAGGTIRLLNASAAALLRLDETQAVGASLADVAPELAEALAGDARDSIVRLGAGGDAPTLAVRISGGRDGRVLTFDDITQQLLDQRRAAWSDVARRIAHEIKNPLTPIQLAAERLQRRYGKTIDPADTTFGRLTETIVRQVGDLRRIVDEFSSFARMPKPVFHDESAIDIARQALFLHEVAHPAITFALDAPDVAHLVCDRRQIGQALTNIVKNAVEAVEAREGGNAGAVTIALRPGDPDECHLTLTVADDGIGLPVERDRIVEPYMTTRARGTGLGLAIVKKIVEEHCGTIAFDDRPGGGTVVTIVFDTAALDALLGDTDHHAADGGNGALTILTRTKP